MPRWTAPLLLTFLLSLTATAQITTPSQLSISGNRRATLEDQLVNRLRATSLEQREYLTFVVNLVENKKLDIKLVVAIERYARRRNSAFPFPYFERALRYEAGKRGIELPTVRQYASTKPSRL